MKIDVTKERVAITECHVVTEGEYCVNECEFYLPECFDGLTVTAVFNDIPVPLLNNRCYIPSLKKGGAVLGVYAYRKNGDNLELVYSPKPTAFFVDEGSYTGATEPEEVPEISKYEEYCTMLAQVCENLIIQMDYVERASLIKKISEENTHLQVPSAKAVYDANEEIITRIETVKIEMDDKEKELQNNISNALVGKTSGEDIVVADVSPVYQEIECEIKSKNILPFDDTELFSERKNFSFDTIFPSGYYSFSAIVESENDSSDYCLVWLTLDGVAKKGFNIDKSIDGKRSVTENIYISTAFNGISFFAGENMPNSRNDNARLFNIQFESGAVATEYVPYFECDNISVISGGKNMSSVSSVQCDSSGDGECYKKVDLGYTLPPCTYSFSAMVTSTDTDTDNCMVVLINEQDGVSQEVCRLYFPRHDKQRVTVENQRIEQSFNCMMFYPAENEEASVGDTATFGDIQIEVGENATDFNKYQEVQELLSDSQGRVNGLVANYPVTTILSSKKGVVFHISYNRDINKAFAAIEESLLNKETI